MLRMFLLFHLTMNNFVSIQMRATNKQGYANFTTSYSHFRGLDYYLKQKQLSNIARRTTERRVDSCQYVPSLSRK